MTKQYSLTYRIGSMITFCVEANSLDEAIKITKHRLEENIIIHHASLPLEYFDTGSSELYETSEIN